MTRALVTSLFVACGIALSGCAADPPPSIRVHWSLLAVYVVEAEPGAGVGGHARHGAGSCWFTDRATIYAQREGELAQAVSTSMCDDNDRVVELPAGQYDIWVDLVTRHGKPYARSAVHHVELTEAEQPVDVEMLTDGVFLQSTWKVVSAAGASVGCPGPTVQLTTYREHVGPSCVLGFPCFTATLPCAAGGGVFDEVPRDLELPQGVVRLDVLDTQGAVIASSEPVVYTVPLGNQVETLGELTITQP